MRATPEPDAAQVSILMVDDHPANLLALEAILEPLGQRLVRAHSGEEALKWLLKETFAVILMDVQMPGMDGFSTVQLIKQHERTRHIPVIFLTALSRNPAHIFQGYAQGAVDYLMKPFEPEILRSKVAVFVELFRKTEQVKQQQALLAQREREALERRSERRFQHLIESMPACVWAADPRGRVTYANRQWLEYSGLAREQARESFSLALHPQDLERTRLAWRESVGSGQPLELQVRLRDRRGDYRWHLGRAAAERDEAGAITGWILAATDIHAQKRAEEELAQFKASLDATEDLVAMFTQDSLALHYVNDGAVKQLGYPREELLGKTVLEVAPELDGEGFRKNLRLLVSGQDTSITYQTAHRRKDGSTFPVEVILQHIPEPQGPGHFVCVARDITERTRVEESLRLANQAKDAFLAAASHELRTPLQAAKGHAHLALMKLGDATETGSGRSLRIISRQIDRMSKLVADLLDVSRIQAGRLSLELEEFDLVELLEETHERMRVLSSQHELHLCATERIRMKGDRGRLDQVITNLVSNAIRYSPEGGPVTMQAAVSGEYVHVSVSDAGLGIPKDKQQLIFERFGRAHSTNYGGLGLGLSICQGIVEQHGGRIWVESDGEAKRGSTFHVLLPLQPVSRPDQALESGEAPATPAQP